MAKRFLTALATVSVITFFTRCFNSNHVGNTKSSLKPMKENIVKTGQTTCYNKSYPAQQVSCSSPLALHDDGWWATVKNIGQASSFNSNAKHTIITDNITKLMWQNTPHPLSMDWEKQKIIATTYRLAHITTGSCRQSSSWRRLLITADPSLRYILSFHIPALLITGHPKRQAALCGISILITAVILTITVQPKKRMLDA